MAKDPFSVYEFKRTKSWWKMKDEIEADGEIVGFKRASQTQHSPTLSALLLSVWRMAWKLKRPASSICTDDIWNNQDKYLGRIVKVNAHEETPDGSLRHPRLKWPSCLRDTEDRIGDKE